MTKKYEEQTQRMRSAGKLKNDSALARDLGVTPQALSNYKKRGQMPLGLIQRFAEKYNLTIDWILTGEGKPYRDGFEGDSEIIALEDQREYGREELKKITAFAALSPDEIIAVGRLLKVMRSAESVMADVLLKHLEVCADILRIEIEHKITFDNMHEPKP